MKNKLMYFPLIVFISLAFLWLLISQQSLVEYNQLWAASYQIIALYGGFVGLYISNQWGGHKSLLGKTLLFFSIGLFLQSFGQSVYSFYIFFEKVDVPYPSVGDIGYFGSVVSYIIGSIYLAKVSGFKFSFKSLKGKLISIIVPLVILVSSYLFFLKGYIFDLSDKLKIFLDFGYPFGQAIYVSVAIIALLMSKDILGGILKKPIIFITISLFFQYVCDFMFLYQANKGEWYAGGINDFIYLVSYLIMCISLIYIGDVFKKIQES